MKIEFPVLRIIVWLTMILLCAAVSATNAAGVIDQRDPVVVQDIEHMQNALKLVQQLKSEIAQLSGTDTFPGVDKVAMAEPLNELEALMQLLLSPERKRYEIKSLSAKSIFFKNVSYKELYHEDK